MKVVNHTAATATTAEQFDIETDKNVRYTVYAPFEVKNLFKRDWQVYMKSTKSARYITETKPGQQAIQVAKQYAGI